MTISLPQLLTNSRLSAKKKCARLHYYRYELGVRPQTDAVPLRMGAAFHKGVELRHTQSTDDAIANALADYELAPQHWSSERVYDWMVERETVAVMLAAYFWRWAPGSQAGQPDEIVERVATELPFQVPIINPDTGRPTPSFVLAGKIDGIVRLADGRLAIHEIKTTGDDIGPESDYWARLRVDHQISTYVHAARRLGHHVETVIYDVAKKPDIRPRQIPLVDDQGVKIVHDASGQRVRTKDGKKWRESGDTDQGFVLQTRPETPTEFGMRFLDDIVARPSHYYARREIPRLDADMREFEHELWDQQQELREAQTKSRWYRNTQACVGFGTCEYARLCWNGIAVDPAHPPDGFVAVQDLHPELKG